MILPYPLQEDKPVVLDYSNLYTPDDPNNTGRYVPPVGTLVWKNNKIFKVVSVDATTSASTLVPAYMDTDDGDTGISSFISWGNDILRLYLDARSKPYRAQVDPSLILIGGAPSFYTLTRYAKDPKRKRLISKYYDSTGKFVKEQVPIVPLDNGKTGWICDSCSLTEDLDDDEEILLTVYNEVGAEIRTAVILAKHSSIINDQLDYRPRVVSLTLKSPQQLPDGTIFIYEKQDFNSLNVYGILTFEDGTERIIQVDNIQTYLYGVEDLVSSYSGMIQLITMKYFYGPSESSLSTDPTNQSITTTGKVMVMPNKEAAPVKVSVIPTFNKALQRYDLRYFIYSTTRERVVDCTNFTTIQQGGVFDGTDYVHTQQFNIVVDMTKVDPTIYQGVANYTQGVSIKLLPHTSYIRWTISDSLSSPFTYGMDSTSDRRPVLYYDKVRGQYFIPSSIFGNIDAVLQSFYRDANPPYDTRVETSVPMPTHFGIRDPFSSVLLSLQPLSDFTKGFNLSVNNDYTDQTVIVEFQLETSDGNLILFGVPVDVYPGTLRA